VTIPNGEPSDDDLKSNAELTNNLQRLLFDIHIMEGALICPACDRSYPIRNGIPNMLLNETEV
jgi:multifunctional methyltransferase subunit TRM112